MTVFERLKSLPHIQNKESSDFDLNPELKPRNRAQTPAAVLVALYDFGKGPELLLTRRSSALRHHPGQIAFPGGKKDETDQRLEDTALREAHEEIALAPELLKIYGRLSCHETVSGFQVTPILAEILERPQFQMNSEVSDVFWVPFEHFTHENNWQIQSRRWQGTMREYYVIPYGPYYIWGATARILKSISEAYKAL